MKKKILATFGAIAMLASSLTFNTFAVNAASTSEGTISSNSFDGGKDNGKALSYTTGNNGQALTIVQDSETTDNYYLHVPGTPGGLMQWKPQGGYEKMSQGWNGEKYVIEFDLRVPNNNEFGIYFGKDGSYDKGIALLYLHPNKALYFSDQATAESVLKWTTNDISNIWMHYKMELDLTAKSATTELTGVDTRGKQTHSISNELSGGWNSTTATPFDTIAFMTKSGGSIDLDNFSIKAVANSNSVSSASYTASGKIDIKFAYPIKSAEVSDFTVKDSSGNTVTCSSGKLSSDGLTYVLTPSESLAYGTYTVEVADSVASVMSARQWETVKVTMKIADPKELGYHTFDNVLDNGVALNASGNTAPSIQQSDDGNYYLYVPAIGWSMSRWFPAETSDVMKDEWLGDTYTVDFDFMSPQLGDFSLHFANTGDDRNGPNIFSFNQSGGVGYRERAGSAITAVGTITANTWYHYTFELNIGNKTGKAILKDSTGRVLGQTEHVSLVGEYDDWWKKATKEPFCKLAFLPVNGTLALDNVKFSRDYFDPTVSDESITILKNTEKQAWADVSLLADTININFGTKMDADTLADNVYITKKGDTNKLACTASLDNKVYSLSVKGLLEKGTEYEIHILGDAANVLGAKLGTEKTFNFSTNSGKVNVDLLGITKGGTAVTSFSDFSGDVKINMDYENTTGEKCEFYVIVAQYSAEDKLVKVEFAKVEKAKEVTSDSIEFEYQASHADDAAYASVMVWKSFDSMKPFDSAIDLL